MISVRGKFSWIRFKVIFQKSMSKICIPLRAKSFKELERQIKKTENKADLLEIWLDCLQDFGDEVAPKKNSSAKFHALNLIKLSRKPLLIVNKSKLENGLWQWSEAERIQALIDFAKAGAAYIDIGIQTKPGLIKKLILNKHKSKIIISYHNFSSTPPLPNLLKILKKALDMGADLVKIVTFTKKNQDNYTIFKLLEKAGKEKLPLIAHCMGKYGTISRVFGPKYGSKICYVALDQKSKTAPGQLTLAEFKKFKNTPLPII